MWTDEEFRERQGLRAEARVNEKFLLVMTLSGRGLVGRDDAGSQYIYSPGVEDRELGEAVQDALSRSRFISLEEYKTFFHPDVCKREHEEWLQMMWERFGYKTKRALYKGMKNVTIQKAQNLLKFSPSHQERSLDYWSGKGLGPEDDVTLPATASPAEIGAALRLAFSRCTGP